MTIDGIDFMPRTALFGAILIGFAGIFPGPALLLLGSGLMSAVVFVVALLYGIFIFEYPTNAGRA